MKVYLLKSRLGVHIVNSVIEIKDFYLVPIHSSNDFTAYSKEVYTIEMQEAKEKPFGFAEER